MQDPTLARTSIAYSGATSTADASVTLDGLGRTSVTQRKQSQTATTYDSVQTKYDVNGRLSQTSVPYSGTAGQANGSVWTTTSYDALNRPTQVQDGGGGTAQYTYAQNDVYVTVGPAATGENTKRRQLEYDALGRLTSVCEITTGTGSGTCGQNVTQTGYWAKYIYDALNNLLTVTQNAQGAAQTRTFTYDGLSRLTSEKTPETNQAAYSYTFDTDTTCGTSKGDLVKRVDPVGTTACYAYDALHRLTAVTYSGGYATDQKHFVYDAATVNGSTMSYAKGRLAEAYTGTSKTTDLGFSYSKRGEVTGVYESTPHSGGYYHVNASYWENGLVKVLTPNMTGMPNWTYTPDGEGRAATVSASSGTNPVTGTAYNVFSLPTAVTYGSADADAFSYDANTGRMTQYKATVNGSAAYGSLTWNANGSLSQNAITDPFNAANAQTCAYAHDDLARVTTADCGSGKWGQSFK